MLKLINALTFHVLMNAEPGATGGGSATAAPTEPATPAAPIIQTLGGEPVPAAAAPAAQGGLDFLPEAYRQDPALARYKNAEEFVKGFKNLEQLVGKKEVINGIIPPGENATEEEYKNFYKQLGHPESADKYSLPDVQAPEGIDLAAEKKIFSELAHKSDLTDKQAAKLFKNYMEVMSQNVEKPVSMEEVKKQAFGADAEANFELANKGARAFGLFDKIESAGQGRNPIVLQLCAELGKLAGEGSYHGNDSAASSRESLMGEALKIQNSPEYRRGDKEAYAKVTAIYERLHPKLG